MSVSIPGQESDLSAEPNVVPLCDVLLVLLIIFMVVTPLVQKGIDVRLPTALNMIDMPDNPDIVLYIRQNGSMSVNQDLATMETLQGLLEEILLTASDKKLYLKADSDLEYGKIVDIIDIIQLSGIDIVGIIAEKKAARIE